MTAQRGHGAGWRIRTSEGISQQIYSLSCLTASLTLHVTFRNGYFCIATVGNVYDNLSEMWSHLRDSNPRPAVYKTAALAN